MSPNEYFDGTDDSEKAIVAAVLNSGTVEEQVPGTRVTLIEVYKEQWRQIRHLDGLDTRAFLLVPVIVGTLNVLYQAFSTPVNKEFLIPLGVIEVGLAWLGIYTVVRNWLCYQRRFIILGETERALGLVEARIVPPDIQFHPPSGFLGFGRRLFFSMRGPMAVFYSLLIWAGLYTLSGQAKSFTLQSTLPGIQFQATFGPFASVDRALWSALLTFFLGLICLWMNYASIRRELPAVARTLHIKRGEERDSLEKPSLENQQRRAQMYLDLARNRESENSPELLEQAIRDYYHVLQLDPNNQTAKEGILRIESRLKVGS